MYINDNKIHGSHGFSNQVQAFHHFIQSIVRTLPPANHDGALPNGTLGDLMNEPVDDKGNPLVHHFVQIGRDTGHLRHHANLKKQKKTYLSILVMRKRKKMGLYHSPTTGDPSYDGNGGIHFSGGHAVAPPLGSTTDLRPGVAASMSGSIWATP